MGRIKKEDIFYTMLKEQAALISETAEAYENIVAHFPESCTEIPQMKVYETTCDERVKAIMSQLYVSFITPLDREDISALTLALDDVVDAMYGVSIRMALFNIEDSRLEGHQMASLAVRAVHVLQDMIEHLPHYKTDRVVMDRAIEVGDIEDEGDTVYQAALHRLFHENDSVAGKYAVTWLRIFDRMESVLDACDRAAGIVRSIVMKDA